MRYDAFIYAIIVAILWGVAPILDKKAVGNLNPLIAALYRSLGAIIFLVIISLFLLYRNMRLIFFYILLMIYWTFLVLVPLNVYAEDITFTCKPVIAGMPKKDGEFYVEDIHDESTPLINIMPISLFLIREDGNVYYNLPEVMRKIGVGINA